MKPIRFWIPLITVAFLWMSIESYRAAYTVKTNGGDVTIPTVWSMQSGSFSVALLETNKVLTFASPMPDTSYEAFFNPLGNLAVIVSYTARTTTNMTVQLSASVSGSISYLIVDN